jgi:protein-S-isoprenylcysteine O-methyltransferase
MVTAMLGSVLGIAVAALVGGLAAFAVAAAGNFASFAIWVLAGITGASYSALALRARRDPIDGRDPGAFLLGLAFLAVLCAAAWDNRSTAEPLHARIGGSEVAGMALIATGSWLRRRAVAALGRHFTMRMGIVPGHRVVRSGPYRWLRHPNYAGLVLIAFGTAIALASPLAIAAAAAFWLPAVMMRVLQEEGLLARALGAEYERYARATWRLLPGVF